ncbi:peptidoglycan DD-metalloendopeptidase family protein [Nocardioides zeae]|uniref:Peptidoglycan DD-metalloendopeptidase family protein n=1 Tax=Nocardioides imazamoxiresistens TaxID=3231893 RepID=A0ABU3PVD6_9ACTN|nr:peptidoglycan DD-metalloendopeptidase family protein [Nocardioides zeae]MDT9592782.1 peptidoglycan DD-metalloendopeptidase family protein [Nocardioides zeae]
MGNHRGDRRGPRRSASPEAPSPRTAGGKRAARPAPRRRAEAEVLADEAYEVEAVALPATRTTEIPLALTPAVAPVAAQLRRETDFEDTTLTLPAVPADDAPVATTYDVRGFEAQRREEARAARSATAATGRRKAVKPTRRPAVPAGFRLPVLPSAPVVAGVAVLAISAAGAVTASGAGPLAGTDEQAYRVSASTALSGNSVSTSGDLLTERNRAVSRDSERDALEDAAADSELAETEAQAAKRSTALETLAQSAEEQAAIVAANAWVLPVDSYRLTNRFGDARSYYSSGYHTGLDFAAASGTQIRAVAGGVVTSAGFEGSYGNKTVITLEDGTEMWYAHQSSLAVSVGDTVAAGDLIGYVGSTGNSTGPHLHLEVRPGAGDPVDPFRALQVNGVTP